MQDGAIKNLIPTGTTVIVRTHGGAPRAGRIISVTERAACVCGPEYFDAIMAGEHEPPIAGFPREDVFEFDERVLGEIRADPANWRLARPIDATADQ